MTLRPEPLPADDVEELIPPRFGAELRERIARAAGGNPLFITEMLAMTGDAQADVVVPPTLQALLAARLDQLAPSERGVLERGAVEGEIFHRGAVQALAPDEPQVTPRLVSPGSSEGTGAGSAAPRADVPHPRRRRARRRERQWPPLQRWPRG